MLVLLVVLGVYLLDCKLVWALVYFVGCVLVRVFWRGLCRGLVLLVSGF